MILRRLLFTVSSVVLCSACEVPDATVDAGTDAGVDVATDARCEIGDGCPDDVCVDGCAHPIAGLCLPPRIDSDTAFAVVTTTSACLSSSCTIVQSPVCDVRVEGDRVIVGGSTCAADDVNQGGCSEDCGGGTGGICTIAGLAAGTWTFVVDGSEQVVVVPFSDSNNSATCFGDDTR